MAAGPQTRSARTADFTFKAGTLDTEALKIVGFEGSEGISELYSIRVDFCSDDPDVDFDAVVAKPCSLAIAGPNGVRELNGMVRRFERTGDGTSVTYYAAEIVPAHWQLSRRIRSRIFQEHNCPDMTVPGIIKKVLADAGIPADLFRFALQATYPTREYVVQYRESEMDFISRLMEDEGIFFFFEHKDGKHVMVIGDSDVAHTDNPVGYELHYRDPSGLVAERDAECIYRLRDRREVQIGTVHLHDFNFIKPQLKLAADVAADRFTSLELRDYPAIYAEKPDGQHYAQIRLEEYQCQRHVLNMWASARGLVPGFRFSLVEHPAESLNAEYLITQVRHRARQPQSAEGDTEESGTEYSAELRTIPAHVLFRPPRRTPKPMIRGAQTAFVVGPAGEEIYTDSYGRVKVQFHWDEEGQYNENSSCWIRVSQGAAGGQYGMMFLPRVGQEVVVDFLEGNPDRPLIIGRVYNNDCMPPYALPDGKTRSCIKTNSLTGGGTNEIRFEDKKGEEQILIRGEKDFHLRVKNNYVETILNEHHQTVEKDKFETYKTSVHTEITADRNLKIGGKDSLNVDGDLGIKTGGKFSIDAGGDVLVKSGGKLVLEAGGGLTIKVGGNFVLVDSGGVTVVGTKIKLNSGGSAGSVSPVSLTAPAANSLSADDVEPGADVTYSGGSALAAGAVETGQIAGQSQETAAPDESSWIEIELTDEAGKPVPYEKYRVTLPNGRSINGWLDGEGKARVVGIKPGNCEVTFPNLDKDAWWKRA